MLQSEPKDARMMRENAVLDADAGLDPPIPHGLPKPFDFS
jgi:hypothetical protein